MHTYAYTPTPAAEAALAGEAFDLALTGDVLLDAVDAGGVETGDVVLVATLADLASTTRDAVRVLAALRRRGLHARVLSPAVDTRSVEVAALIDGLYQLEPRQRPGRRTVVTPERLARARELREEGATIAAAAEVIGVSFSALQRALAHDTP